MHAHRQPLADEAMATAAGFGNVGVVERRLLVEGPKNPVRSMAVRARSRYKQPRGIQAMAVDALLIGFKILLVTSAAGLDLVVEEHRRAAVRRGQQMMRNFSVAVRAAEWRSSPLRVTGTRLAVDARKQIQLLMLVADTAALLECLASLGLDLRVRIADRQEAVLNRSAA